MMKLIVSDMDGTLLNSKNEISDKNVEALLAAQQKGIEIAIATGRTYKNALALCQRYGLKPHIISNHGAFIYTKEGELLKTVALEPEDVHHAVDWLEENSYFYDLCTDEYTYMPRGARKILLQDFEQAQAGNLQAGLVERKQSIDWLLSMEGIVFVDNMREVAYENNFFGNIAAMTYNKERLTAGREYFKQYPGVTMTVAADELFEMIHSSASKGNAVEYLAGRLHISLQDIMAIGDHYNDISMLERVGVGVAIGNAKEGVKKVCQHVSLSNDHHGVAYIVEQMLKGWKPTSCNG